MNANYARILEENLKGRVVGGWTIVKLVGYGKSAAVFRARNGRQESALKIFDSELIERYGRVTQLNRIKREVALSEKKGHPNLVKIYGGGHCEETGHLYVSMEFIEATSLDEKIQSISRDKIRDVIRDVACAAHYLESEGIAHRDIKPANIAINDVNQAVLLDLGVLRAIASPGDTDADAKLFVGTLQYSSPEFLLRTEEDSIDGWRAVTFYQLGAVLYDLIEQKPIFSEHQEPYAKMVNAVQRVKPDFSANDVPFDLINLAKNCLIKDPLARLNLVTWNHFMQITQHNDSVDLARENIKAVMAAEHDFATNPIARRYEKRTGAEILFRKIHTTVQQVFISEPSLPPLTANELDIQSNRGQFSVSFTTSEKFRLKVYFHICFLLTVLDVQEQTVKIDAIAWIGAKESAHSYDLKCFHNVYGGVFDNDEIGEAVQKFALMAFAKALSLQNLRDKCDTLNCIVDIDEGLPV